jgi:hypothetical protein
MHPKSGLQERRPANDAFLVNPVQGCCFIVFIAILARQITLKQPYGI